jgi:hypothetical protein
LQRQHRRQQQQQSQRQSRPPKFHSFDKPPQQQQQQQQALSQQSLSANLFISIITDNNDSSTSPSFSLFQHFDSADLRTRDDFDRSAGAMCLMKVRPTGVVRMGRSFYSTTTEAVAAAATVTHNNNNNINPSKPTVVPRCRFYIAPFRPKCFQTNFYLCRTDKTLPKF